MARQGWNANACCHFNGVLMANWEPKTKTREKKNKVRGINDWKREQAKQSKYLHGERASITIYPSARTLQQWLRVCFCLCQQMLSHGVFFFVLFCNKKAHTQTTVLRVCLIPVSCIWVAIEILQIARNECENFRIEKQWTWHRFIVLTGSQGKKSREKHRTNNVVELDVCGVCMRRTTPKIGILLRFEHLWTIGQGVNNSFQFTENWDRGGRVAWWW